jgi:D-aminopeptidase
MCTRHQSKRYYTDGIYDLYRNLNLASPTTIRVEFFRSDMADRAEYLTDSHRIDAWIVEYTKTNVIEVSNAFRAMIELAQVYDYLL